MEVLVCCAGLLHGQPRKLVNLVTIYVAFIVRQKWVRSMVKMNITVPDQFVAI